MSVIIGMVIAIGVLIGALYALFKYKNRRLEPDYYEYYKSQDTAPSGRTAVFVTGLIMPETNDNAFFYNITKKRPKRSLQHEHKQVKNERYQVADGCLIVHHVVVSCDGNHRSDSLHCSPREDSLLG